MHNKKYFKLIFVVSVLVSIWSCDDDFIETGSGLINTIELPPLYETDNVIAYSKRVNRVQTNNLNVYTLADFQDPAFGNFKSSLLTQVLLSNPNNDFGTDPVLDSVVLTLPFFSRQTDTDIFTLDSVSGNGEFRIKVFRSNHLLRSFSPGENGEFDENQIYYSDDLPVFQPNIATEPIAEAGPFSFEEDFTESIELVQGLGEQSSDTLTLSPRIRIQLPVPLFQELILDKIGEPELVSNAFFVNFFRGLHIVMENAGGEGASAAFNLLQEDANITLHYNTQRPLPVTEEDPEEEFETVYNRFRLAFNGIKVNLFEDEFNVDASNPNLVEGDENLYLKGGAGFFTEVELFSGPDSDGDGVSDELQDLRDRELLINEANLEFFVNEEIVNSKSNYVNRIILFNIEDNAILVDYERDRTADDNPNSSRRSHLGPLTNTEGVGRSYRLRITDHLNRVINSDSINVKLGLMITENVNSTIQIEAESNTSEIEEIFRPSVQFTKGTVLHGSNSPNEDKRIKLKLQVTEIN